MRLRSFVRVAACVLVVVVIAVVAGAAASAKPRPPAPDRTPPTQPTNLRVTAVTQTSVTLAWNASTDNVGVRSYSLWGEELSGVVSATHPQTTATWSNLRPGQTVTFRVTAFDANYNASTPSAPVRVTTLADSTAPSLPSGLTVGRVTASQVELTWNSGTDQFNPVRHEILVDGVPTNNAVSTVPAGTNPRPPVQSAWVRQLDLSTNYTFSVRAIDPSGNVSALSNTAGATTLASTDTAAPTTPTLLSAFDGGSSFCPEELWIRWTGSTDGAQPASAIEYEVRVNGAINEVIPGGTQTITYTEVLGANTVTIVAVDQAGNASAPSNAITVFTNWAPGGCGL
jgi:cellulose 1,4-beta-cellobiosidase